MSSCAPMRVKMRSTRPIAARSAGTNEPIWAISTISATCRSQVAFAGHVRPGQHDDLRRFGVEMGVVGHELAASEQRFQGRVAPGVDLDRDAVVRPRGGRSRAGPRPRPVREHVEMGDDRAPL